MLHKKSDVKQRKPMFATQCRPLLYYSVAQKVTNNHCFTVLFEPE